ncbi:MAG TPA: methyltransferase, partial [Candidatus Binatia bacterium]|nr:methyltransferase [Candidatus Binatia bacterium]
CWWSLLWPCGGRYSAPARSPGLEQAWCTSWPHGRMQTARDGFARQQPRCWSTGSLDLLREDTTRTFALAPMGEWLCRDHPHSLRGMTLLEEGPETYATWRHLPALITEGQQNAFVREFGQPVFERAAQNPSYGAVINEAMSSYSRIHTTLVLEALEHYDFSGITHLCDVGGGHGYMLCSLLVQYPHLRGTVLELPSVIAQHELLWADKMGVGDRCTFVPGDMFREVPPADAYM